MPVGTMAHILFLMPSCSEYILHGNFSESKSILGN